jgi:hypothetical protein
MVVFDHAGMNVISAEEAACGGKSKGGGCC